MQMLILPPRNARLLSIHLAPPVQIICCNVTMSSPDESCCLLHSDTLPPLPALVRLLTLSQAAHASCTPSRIPNPHAP